MQLADLHLAEILLGDITGQQIAEALEHLQEMRREAIAQDQTTALYTERFND